MKHKQQKSTAETILFAPHNAASKETYGNCNIEVTQNLLAPEVTENLSISLLHMSKNHNIFTFFTVEGTKEWVTSNVLMSEHGLTQALTIKTQSPKMMKQTIKNK